MKFQLRAEDRRAVDLILDRAAGAREGHAVYAAADPSLSERVARAQRLLNLLNVLPEPELPPGLVGRTMRLIERTAQPHAAETAAPAPERRPMV